MLLFIVNEAIVLKSNFNKASSYIVNSGKFILQRTGEITEQNNCFMAKTNLLPREITTTIVSQNPALDHLIVV